MIQLDNIKVKAQQNMTPLVDVVCSVLGVPKDDVINIRIAKRSIDARRKPEIYFIYTLLVSLKNEQAVKGYEQVTLYESEYMFEQSNIQSDAKIVVVGAGPAGLFLSYRLALAGLRPLVVERGKTATKRKEDIDALMLGGKLNPESNVLFGLGGAGTFSDGKLNTGTNNPYIKKVLRTFVECGAPAEIEYINKPHIGSDKLLGVVENLKDKIISLGGSFLFETKMTAIHSKDGRVESITVENKGGKQVLDVDYLCLCIGHSARDTFRMLLDNKFDIEPKPFSMGVRIEHRRQDINFSQYAISDADYLPTADYKIFEHLPSGRTVYSFCMCPGGVVVPAMNADKTMNVNGMSYYGRNMDNSNSAILVNVDPKDYFDGNPLSGVEYQEYWERKAYALANDGNDFVAPIETLNSFLYGKENVLGNVVPSYRPGYKLSSLSQALPDFVTKSIKEALPRFNNKIKGFSDKNAVLTGIETRSSSPIRVIRDQQSYECSVGGVYPCGEGCGYAGGIVSSAVDGIRVAEKIIESIIFRV